METIEKKIILLSHEITKTGASILCLKISETLRSLGYHTILISMNRGEISQEYKDGADEVYMIHCEGKDLDPSDEQKRVLTNYETYTDLGPLLVILKRQGNLLGAIVNTVLCGNTVRLLWLNQIKAICLIHEMRASCEILKVDSYIQEIAEAGSYTIFPAKCVKEDFISGCNQINSILQVKPQGYYKKILNYNRSKEYKIELTERLNISKNSKILLGAGSINFGKGVDLLPLLADKLKRHDYHFVWMGSVHDENYAIWLKNQIKKMNLEDRIHFMGYIDNNEEYVRIMCGSDAFLLLSREDSLPSVLMEAMAARLPIIAFKKSGGAEELLASERGYLVDYMDIDQYSRAIAFVLKDNIVTRIRTNRAYKYLKENLIFDDYVKYLAGLLDESDV